MEHFVLQLDEVLIASQQREAPRRLQGAARLPSFKGRIELVRVPYLRRWKVEQEIYDAQVTPRDGGQARRAARHRGRRACGRCSPASRSPIPERYPADVREMVEGLTPLEKMQLYEDGDRARSPAAWPRPGSCKKWLPALYEESDAYPNYEGRTGASAREIKTALFNAAQNPDRPCLSPLAVLEELSALCQGQERLRVPPAGGGGRLPRPRGVRAHRGGRSTSSRWTPRCASRWAWSPRSSTARSSSATSSTSRHWVKGEKMRNRVTGEMERPDEKRMAEMEAHRHAPGRRPGRVPPRAHRADRRPPAREPRGGRWTTRRIFPDLFRRLRAHFFEERKRALQPRRGERAQGPLRRAGGAQLPGAGAGRSRRSPRCGSATATARSAPRRPSSSWSASATAAAQASAGGWLSLSHGQELVGPVLHEHRRGRSRPARPATASTSARSSCATGPSSRPATTAASGACPTATTSGT